MRIALACLLIFGSAATHAQTPLSRSEQAVVDFGFATQLGSGVYTMSGRTLQVYKLPFGYDFDHEPEARVRVRLTLPVTLGFIDFEPMDVVETGVPQSLDSLSVVPGLMLDIALAQGWRLQPFIEAGIARDRASDLDQNIYSVGLRSLYDVSHGSTDWQLYDELLHTEVEQSSLDRTDDFTRLRLGVTARRPFDVAGDGRRSDYLVYGYADLFPDAPEGPVNGESEGNRGEPQFEFGVTFGTTQPIEVWGIALPRIGLGYRFGDDLSVYRLVFGTPF